MTMIEMAHARAQELGFQIRMRTGEDGDMLLALEYPEDSSGSRVGLAIRMRSGAFAEEGATWLLGQMASHEMQAEADRLAADDAPLLLSSSSQQGASEVRSDRADELETRILMALLQLSILLADVQKGESTMAEIASEIGDVATVLNGLEAVNAS